jgi:hypothetical protein
LQAEPVEEPVAWMVCTLDGKSVCFTDNPADLTERYKALPLYTAPPQRLPLTEEDVAQNLRSRHDAAKLLEERRQEITQPRREWQSLSEDELTALGVIHSRYQEESLDTGGWFDFARAIEAALKEKNNG